MSTAASSSKRSRGWARDYPPLLVIGAGLLIVLAVLPSSLNFPRSNPTETLEYAPVPPDDSTNPPPAAGNLGSLGLGTTSGIAEGAVPSIPPVQSIAKDASAKRCVGNPPRQTEDPLSPPCVAFFQGDNFGATYQGITRDEVRILLYVDGNYNDVGSGGIRERPNGRFFDLSKPPEPDENYFIQSARIWQRFFNERFQTYGRFAHFFVTFGTGQTPEARRSDASEAYAKVKPFAVVVYDSPYNSSLPYVETLARRGVLTFGITSERPEELYRQFPKLEWGYWPSVEYHVKQFADYVCTKIVGKPTSFAGNDGDLDQRLHNGQPRRLGLLSTTDPDHVPKHLFARLARKQIEACGGRFVAAATFPDAGFICCSTNNQTASADAMARLKQAGVTTIVYAQGYSPEQSMAAGKLGYRPEWVVAGDRLTEDIVPTKYQDQTVWSHAVIVTNVPLAGPIRQRSCYLASKEVDPDLAIADASIPCRLYEDFRQLFTGIQVAGPRLGPTSIDEGFRAIPNRPSGTPSIPACFYLPGDFTCVKDSIAMYWDSNARSVYSGAPGCYRVPSAGKRFLPGTWTKTDPLDDRSRNDPCNGWSTGQTLDPTPGSESPPSQ